MTKEIKKNSKFSTKKVLSSIIMGGFILITPFTSVYSTSGDSGEVLISNSNSKPNPKFALENRILNLNLTKEEYLDYLNSDAQLRLDYANSLIEALEEEGVDVTNFSTILEDYSELLNYLNSVDLNSVAKEDLISTFFELLPQREGMDDLKKILRETFKRDDILELNANFKDSISELNQEFNLNINRDFHKSSLDKDNFEKFNEIDLSDEEYLSYIIEEVENKISRTSNIIKKLDSQGISNENLDGILNQFSELLDYLNTVDLDEITRDQLIEDYLSMLPENEELKEFKNTLRENKSRK